MAGPNGHLYAIQIFPGCSNCDAAAGIDIWLLKMPRTGDIEDDYVLDAVKAAERLEFWKVGDDERTGIGLLDPEDLDAAVEEELGESLDNMGAEVKRILENAIRRGQERFKKEREKTRKILAKKQPKKKGKKRGKV